MSIPLSDKAWGVTWAADQPATILVKARYDGYVQYESWNQRHYGKSRSPTQVGVWGLDGWRHPTSHSAHLWTFTRHSVAKFCNTTSNYWTMTYRYPAPWPFHRDNLFNIPSVRSAADDLLDATNRGALAKLNDRHMDVGVALAEAHKTIGHLASTASRLLKFLLFMKKGQFSKAADAIGVPTRRRATRTLAKDWLEYQYAWKPLVNDVFDAYDLAQNGLDQSLVLRGERRASKEVSVEIPYWELEHYNSSYNKGTSRTMSRDVTLNAKTILYAEVDSIILTRLKALGLANPASIAWELVPWSFVIDWFLPVGEFLEAISAPIGLSWKGGTTTIAVTGDISASDFGGADFAAKVYPQEKGDYDWKTFSYERSALGNFPYPVLSFHSRFSSEKLATALALWRNLKR